VSLTLASGVEHARRCTALRACGLDVELPMTRGASYANEVWLGREVVLRINWRGVGRLAREALVARRISRDARYPEILAVGDDGEIEWMLTRRVPGIALGHAWATLSSLQRERATHELAAALAALHATPTEGLPDGIHPPHTLPLAPLLELVADTVAPHDPRLAESCAAFITDRWSAFDAADRGLVHGDPHLENVLWDGDHVSALLDLEWSRPSWIHADVEILLAIAADPIPFASADHAHLVNPMDYGEMAGWLRAARPAWFAHPRLRDRLEVLYLSRTLGHLDDDPVASAFRWDDLRDLVLESAS
jgi:aminoglycoside phosphotransferase